jgi:two-component system response regulator HydG
MNRILLVDDDIIFGKNLSAILQDKGYDVDLVDSAEAAFKELKENSFGVVLLDIKLPDLSGIEVFKKIRDLRPETKVIVITAFSCNKLVIQLEENNFFCFSKPFDINLLLKTIERLISERKSDG